MIPQEFEYAAPKTLDEAVAAIADGEAKPLAGGMSLIPMMKLRMAIPEKLIDLGRIRGLDHIHESDGKLHIGAMATHHTVESSELVKEKCPLLATTASWIGDVQVRNRGTLGGSVAHADPAADYPAALQALDATIVLKGAAEERSVSADDFFIDTFMTALEPGEIVREVVVPVEPAGTGTSYQKMLQRASGFAIVGVAVRIRKQDGKITFSRIGVTGLSNRAYRATTAESVLMGTSGSPNDIETAAALVPKGVDANGDLHASAEFRAHLAKVYAARAIKEALGQV